MQADPKTLQSPVHGRIRVVHVMTSLEPGGLENGVVNLANSLDPARFRTSIVCLERIGEFSDRLEPGVAVHCLEKPPGFKWRAGLQLGKLFERLSADVIHTHNLGPLVYGVIARRFGNGRGVILQGEHAQLREDEKTFRRRWMRRSGYRTCTAVHTVSRGLRDELIDLFGIPGEKIRVILNGVDCERFSPVPSDSKAVLRRNHDIPSSAFVVGMAGRFGAFKRHERLLGAFDGLAGRDSDLHLLLVGDHGPEKEKVLARIELSPFRERIHWAGFQIDPAPWYRMMDLLVIPSDNEGLSNVMLEAMACGIPCLAHPACGAGEVIRDGENGFLRALPDEDQLTEEMAKIVDDRHALPGLGEAARRTALEQFSLGAMTEGYERLYEDTCAGKIDSR